MKDIKVNAEEFMGKYVKVTASVKTVTALAIGEVKDFAKLQDEALAKAFELAGYKAEEPAVAEPEAKPLPPVFADGDEQDEGPLPGQISLDVEVEAETSEKAAELAAEKVADVAPAEDDEEDDDPFSFLDDTFNEDEDETPAEPVAKEEPAADEEPEQEEEPAPAPKKRGRPRKVKTSENGMTKEKALATVIEVTSEATSAFRDLAGMTMGELLEKKPTMAKIMIREHIKPQLSAETVEAAKALA